MVRGDIFGSQWKMKVDSDKNWVWISMGWMMRKTVQLNVIDYKPEESGDINFRIQFVFASECAFLSLAELLFQCIPSQTKDFWAIKTLICPIETRSHQVHSIPNKRLLGDEDFNLPIGTRSRQGVFGNHGKGGGGGCG
ncbi:hypothetical protein CEXT_671511 [Caerostris extrusa]|uniref:Uncharacterized protein n=1 Tax=Caerostris extrusa TaxID=172846 RepID=A0AAV4RTX3_CAEEX|nr:hypothetical protein CEXT_671511 [Caerostris extrusa]